MKWYYFRAPGWAGSEGGRASALAITLGLCGARVGVLRQSPSLSPHLGGHFFALTEPSHFLRALSFRDCFGSSFFCCCDQHTVILSFFLVPLLTMAQNPLGDLMTGIMALGGLMNNLGQVMGGVGGQQGGQQGAAGGLQGLMGGQQGMVGGQQGMLGGQQGMMGGQQGMIGGQQGIMGGQQGVMRGQQGMLAVGGGGQHEQAMQPYQRPPTPRGLRPFNPAAQPQSPPGAPRARSRTPPWQRRPTPSLASVRVPSPPPGPPPARMMQRNQGGLDHAALELEGYLYHYGQPEKIPREDFAHVASALIRSDVSLRDIGWVQRFGLADDREAIRVEFKRDLMRKAQCHAAGDGSWFRGYHGTRPEKVQRILRSRCLMSGDTLEGNEMTKIYCQMCADDNRDDLQLLAATRCLSHGKNLSGVVVEFKAFCEHRTVMNGGTYAAEAIAKPGVCCHYRGKKTHNYWVVDESNVSITAIWFEWVHPRVSEAMWWCVHFAGHACRLFERR